MFNSIFKDKDFYKTLLPIAVPIAIHNLLLSMINTLDSVMVGKFGEQSIAALGLSNQLFFLMILICFGISSSASIFYSQYKGANQKEMIKSVLAIALICSLLVSTLIAGAGHFFGSFFIGIFSPDAEVIRIGKSYLQIAALSFPLVSVSIAFSIVLRSLGHSKIPMYSSLVTLVINGILNYLLIFGHFGFPVLGVVGAAIATLIARFGEMSFFIIVVLFIKPDIFTTSKQKNCSLLNRILSFFIIPSSLWKRFWPTALPVIFNELIWASGVVIYQVVYARISTGSIAAINIVSNIENLSFVVFIGLGSAAAIMIGEKIGNNENEKAFEYARRFAVLTLITAVFIGVCLLIGGRWIFLLYNISDDVRIFTERILIIFAVAMWIKVFNLIMVIGIFRSGGDTNFSFIIDAGGVWFIGIPLALLGAFYFNLPVYWVYLMVMIEEFIKFFIGLYRLRSGKWINNLIN